MPKTMPKVQSSDAASATSSELSTSDVMAQLLTTLQQQQQAHELNTAAQSASTAQLLQQITATVSGLVQAAPAQAPARTPPLPNFRSLNDSDDADAWFTMADRVLTGHGIAPNRFALAIAPHLTGKALAAYNAMSANDTTDFALVRTAVLRRFHVDAKHYRKKLRSDTLGESTSYVDLATRLTDIFNKWMAAENAGDVAAVRDVLVREQLIATLSQDVRTFVLEHEDKSALDTAKLVDTYVSARPPPVQRISAVSSGYGKPRSAQPARTCDCGGPHHARSICPAREKSCSACGKTGHYAKVCRTTKRRTGKVDQCDQLDEPPECTLPASVSASTLSALDVTPLFLGVVSSSAKAWYVDVNVNDSSIRFKVDTGAEVTVISSAIYECMTVRPPLTPCHSGLFSGTNDQLRTLGQFSATLTRPGQPPVTAPVYVAQGLRHSLLSCRESERLGLVKRLFDTSEPTQPQTDPDTAPMLPVSSDSSVHPPELPQESSNEQSSNRLPDDLSSTMPDWVLLEFPHLFTGLGSMADEYHIALTDNARPTSIYSPRNVSLLLRAKVHQELQRMESMGIIKPVSGPTDWCHAMVVVPKPDKSVRICVDYKPLNAFIRRELHQLPTVDETLAQLEGSTVFTKLDANSGFWQIPLSEASQSLTTFISPFGRFAFTKLPFGISSAPEVFQRRMSTVL